MQLSEPQPLGMIQEVFHIIAVIIDELLTLLIERRAVIQISPSCS